MIVMKSTLYSLSLALSLLSFKDVTKDIVVTMPMVTVCSGPWACHGSGHGIGSRIVYVEMSRRSYA